MFSQITLSTAPVWQSAEAQICAEDQRLKNLYATLLRYGKFAYNKLAEGEVPNSKPSLLEQTNSGITQQNKYLP